jgi:hypothetical protein
LSKEINYVEFFTGLPLGIAFTLIILLIIWRYGKKHRWFDERSKGIYEKAMSIGWLSTTVGLLIVWSIIILIEGPGLAFWLMTSLWVLHMLSFGIASMIADKKN